MLVHPKTLVGVALLAALLTSATHGQLPVTQLRTLYPPVAQVGATSTVEVLGTAPLDEIDRLIFSHPGISANLVAGQTDPLTGAPQKVFGKFTLAVANDLPPGFYEAWALGRNGASSSRLLWITPRPLATVPQPANDPQPAPALSLDGIVVDRYVAAKVQRYDVALSAGQRIRISALDDKLDSRAISQLKVIAPNNKPVASARSSGPDGAIAEFTADQTGAYRVELRDVIYRGGDEYFYALFAELDDAPRVDRTSAPWNDLQQVLAALAPPAGQLTRAQALAGLGIRRWIATESAFVVSQPGRTDPIAIVPPCLVAGAFGNSSTGEAFDFSAKKGDIYWVDVASAGLGENTDAYVAVYKVPAADATTPPVAAGAAATATTPSASASAAPLQRIVEQDDAPVLGSPPFKITRSDPSFRFEAPADGDYRLVVRDQLASNTATAGKKFLLSVRKPQPALSLVAAWASPTNVPAQAKPIGNNLVVGGTASVRILVDRAEGLAGAVEVSCEGLPAGVSAAPIVIPADRNEGQLILSYPAAAAPAVAAMKIVGKTLSDPVVQTEAIAAELTWEPIPSWNALTSRLSQQLMLFLNEKDIAPISFAVAGDQPLVMARGGKLPLPITVTRRAGGAEKAILRPQNLPTKTTLGDVTIEAAANEAKPELVIAADAPVGETSFWFQAETKVKFKNNPQAFERAEAYRVELEKLLADPARAPQKEMITAALKAATDRVAQLKDQTVEKDIPVFLPTNSVRVKVVEGPIEAMGNWRIDAQRGSESDHPLAINRLFGFDSAIDVKLVTDPPTPGVELTAPAVAAGANQAMCHLKLAADTATGERKLQLKLTYKFNTQDLSMFLPLIVNVRE